VIAIDTNLLVRLLVVDDSAQAQAALQLVENNRIFILRTVLLQTEWVLRSRYTVERERIVRFFEGLADTQGIYLEAEASMRSAIEAYAKGVDFADACHLSVAQARNMPFYTFDTALLRKSAPTKAVGCSRALSVFAATRCG
jgi:predicted nucleic-acid-binding protein